MKESLLLLVFSVIIIRLLKFLTTLITAFFTKPVNEEVSKNEYSYKDISNPNNEIMVPTMETRGLVMITLLRIGCNPFINDKDYFCFMYRDVEFIIDADNRYKTISIWCTQIKDYPVNQKDAVLTAINNTNFKVPIKLLYTMNEKFITIHMENEFVFIPELPEIESYLRTMLDNFFGAYRYFEDELRRIKSTPSFVHFNMEIKKFGINLN